MIFRTINEEINKNRFSIKINNLDVARGHWGDSKQIIKYAESIDLMLYDKESFDKKFIMSSLELFASNFRLSDVSFFKENDGTLVMFVISERNGFKELEPFSRRISFEFKGGFKLDIVELTKKEHLSLKNGNIKLPETWTEDVDLTDKFHKYNSIFG